MKTVLPDSIKTKEQGEAFLRELWSNGEAFHPDDSAHNTVWTVPEEQVPTEAECDQLDRLMDECLQVPDLDPYCFLMKPKC